MYGLQLNAPWLTTTPDADLTIRVVDDREIFRHASTELTSVQRSAVFAHLKFDDGRRYLRWQRLVECIITADRRELLLRELGPSGLRAFRSHLLAPAISFVLLDRGQEILHGGALSLANSGLAIMGDSGTGKSTLAAALIAAGARSISDDLLVFTEGEAGFDILPGPPRLKLFPATADVLLPGARDSVRMNPFTTKRVYSLLAGETECGTAPLRSIWVLTARSTQNSCSIRQLSGSEAVRTLVANTFVTVEQAPARQARLLQHAANLAARVPVYSLTLPQGLSRLVEQRAAIARALADRAA
jgi:hypothetical protein